MALTDSQLTSIRNQIGDIVTDDPDLSDERLQELYTEHGTIPLTMLHAAYERRGILMNETDTTDNNTLITEKRKQRFDSLVQYIIPSLEKQAGMSGGVLSVGLLRHHLDSRSDEDAL